MAKEALINMGFTFISGTPGLMDTFHRHREVEINLVVAGEMTYLFGATRTTLTAGQLSVFWATIPHRLIRIDPDTRFFCVHLPLARFLQWQLPDSFTSRLLHGEMIRDTDTERAERDIALFDQWRMDVATQSSEAYRIVYLEVEARIRRLVLTSNATSGRSSQMPDAEHNMDKVERMMAFIGEQYQHPVTIDDIAAEVDLHPKYAITLFRKHCGMTLGEYLTQLRLSQAQRLLATSEAKVVDIAFESGFGSISRFYQVFERACGQSPKMYRASLQR